MDEHRDDPAASIETDPEVAEAIDQVEAEAAHEMMALLSQHVPLTLLADLALRNGPASPDILEEEGLPEERWWEAGRSA